MDAKINTQMTQKKNIELHGQVQNGQNPNTKEEKLLREMESVLFENHDLRQRLSLCQQELISWRSQFNEQGENIPNSIPDLQRQLQVARQEKTELWQWSEPEINRLKSEIERLEREKKELWEWCEPRMKGRSLIGRAKDFILRIRNFCKRILSEEKK